MELFFLIIPDKLSVTSQLGVVFFKLVFSFLSGAENFMSDIGAKGTLLKDGGNQEQGIDVHDIDFLACTLASRVKRIAAI